MDAHHHKITTISAGHEGQEGHDGHGVHLCHRCGWPFPNPHPSAKHRRAHKRVCGKIEGYELEHDHHLPVSDDDKTSDEEEHTPSPKPAKQHVAEIGGGGGVGEMSNRSEDDVFTDAVTEFSDSGLSHQTSEQFESVTGLIKEEGQKGSGIDTRGIESSDINETAGETESCNDSTNSKEIRNPGAPVHPNNESGTVLLVSDSSAEAVSLIVRDVVEDDVKTCVNGETESVQKKAGQDSDIPVGENKLPSVDLDSKEGIISDPELIGERKEEELRDKLVAEVVKPDLLPRNETFHDKNASAVVESAAVSAEISCSAETSGEINLAKEIHENTNTSTGVEKVCASTEEVKLSGIAGDILPEETQTSKPPLKHAENTPSLDAPEPFDAVLSIKEIEQKSSSTEVKDDGNSGMAEVGSARKETSSEIETAGSNASNVEKCDAAGNENDSRKSEHKHSVESAFVAEAVQTVETLNEDVKHCEEKSDKKSLDAGIETIEGDSEEVKVIHARNIEELPKPESSTVEPFPGQSSDKLNDELHSVGSDTGGLSHNGDVLDKEPISATSECPMSQVISELPKNIHVPSTEPVTKESSAFTESGLLNENSESRCIGEGVREVDDSKASTEPNREDLDQTQHKNPPAEECLKEILPVKEKLLGVTEASPDTNPMKPYGIDLNADQTSDSDNVVASEKCSITPSLKEAAPSLVHSRELQETSTPCGKENVISVEPIAVANSKPLQAERDEKLSVSRDVVSPKDLSGNSSVKSESLDGNCGTVSDISFDSNMAVANSPSSESFVTGSQQHEAATDGAHRNKSDDFEPPSFMTLVETNGKEGEVCTASEIETVQSNRQPISEAPQPGWFPSLTNVVNESEGRKKNEEIIAKVTHSSPVKHSPLKNLLNDAKQGPAANPKDETEPIVNNGAGATKAAAPTQNDHGTHKDIDEWNSPARYPIETKKDKKKGKSMWVPFMCCSSVHKDL